MTLLSLIITIVLVGVVLYLIDRYIPMDAGVKTVLHAVVIILLVFWLLSTFGLVGHLNRPIGR